MPTLILPEYGTLTPTRWPDKASATIDDYTVLIDPTWAGTATISGASVSIVPITSPPLSLLTLSNTGTSATARLTGGQPYTRFVVSFSVLLSDGRVLVTDTQLYVNAEGTMASTPISPVSSLTQWPTSPNGLLPGMVWLDGDILRVVPQS
jgi:hypothetical protein